MAYNITILRATYYPTKGAEWCLACKKINSILGHQHISAHKTTFNLFQKEK